MSKVFREGRAPERAASPGTGPQPKYLEVRLRRPASIWPVLRAASLVAAIALAVVLVVRPALGLFVFWSLLVPSLPLVFLIAPSVWRNLCPIAAANRLPRFAGLTRDLPLPRWLERHGYAIAAVVFLSLVASRKLGLDTSGAGLAALVGGVLSLALVGGALFHGKSAFCGGICPLRPTQGLLGQTPTLKVASHCQPCVGCTPNCTDLKPDSAFEDELMHPDPRRGADRRLFAGSMPGFVLGFYMLPAAGAVPVATVLAQLGAFSLASLGAFFALEQLVVRTDPARVTAAFAAAAFGLFYWFNFPIVAAAVARGFDASAPGWVIWEGRLVFAALAVGWLVVTLRAQRRRALAERSPSVALPLAPATGTAGPGATTAAPASPVRGLGVVSAPPVPPLADASAPDADSMPAAAPRPTAGDPPVPIPDRRAPGHRAEERRGHERRMRRFEVTLQPEGHILDATPGSSLLDVCRAAGLPIDPGCRMGLCGQDPIYVVEGAASLSVAGTDERATLERLGLPGNARMACAARVLGDLVVSFQADPVPAPGTGDEPTAQASPRSSAAGVERGGHPSPPSSFGAPDTSVARVVILGNGIAGVTAADHVRRHHPDCEIELVAAEPHAFYNRTSVSRLVYSREGMDRMYLLPPSWYRDRRITTSLNTRAASIDRAARRVVLGTGEELTYDRLVLATGSRPRIPPIEGFGLEGSFTLRGADDAMRLRAYAQQRRARRAVIVGGGVLGLEAADAARKLGLEATIVELADRLSPVQLDEHAAGRLRDEVESRGIEVVLGRSVTSVGSDGERVSRVSLDDGSERSAEIVVLCAGITPNAEIAREAGLEVGRGVLVDDTLRTSDAAIYAAGDVAEFAGRLYGHWPAAVEQAEAAAVNAIGGRRRYTGSLVATHLKVTGVELTSIGRPHVEPDDIEITFSDDATRRYRKLVIADGRIVGAILLGHPSEASAVFAAAREGRDVSTHLQALSNGDWDVLTEPSFDEAADATTASANGHARPNGQTITSGRPTRRAVGPSGSAPAKGRASRSGGRPGEGTPPLPHR